jgi:transcriptional regulator NrdR family protein
MTETDISKSQVETMIQQIESMLIDVSGHNNVPAADMRDGLLDLLNMANALEDE